MTDKAGRVGPQMPSEASSGGQLNQSTPMEQRAPDRIIDVGTGPKIGALGEYQPAKYERSWTNPATGETHTQIVEDR
jgi:hypothetical protein